MLLFTNDKKRLARHFERDRVLFAYHLGDLDDFQSEHCQWAVTYQDTPRIQDVILLYTGLSTPTLLAFGLGDRFGSFLEEMLQISPRKFHGHFQAEFRAVFQRAGYREQTYGSAWKMQLQRVPDDRIEPDDRIVRLDSSHERQLLALYERGYPDNYFDRRMLVTGKYFGYVDEGQIVAVTGVHVDSDKYRVACLGNIVTDPDYRGRGLATVLTARLVRELCSEEKTVCLNVMGDNLPAIRCYEKLGFVKVHEYEEALFTLIRKNNSAAR